MMPKSLPPAQNSHQGKTASCTDWATQVGIEVLQVPTLRVHDPESEPLLKVCALGAPRYLSLGKLKS